MPDPIPDDIRERLEELRDWLDECQPDNEIARDRIRLLRRFARNKYNWAACLDMVQSLYVMLASETCTCSQTGRVRPRVIDPVPAGLLDQLQHVIYCGDCYPEDPEETEG